MKTKWLGKHPVLATFPIIAEEPHQFCVPGSIHTISFSTIQLPRLFARSPAPAHERQSSVNLDPFFCDGISLAIFVGSHSSARPFIGTERHHLLGLLLSSSRPCSTFLLDERVISHPHQDHRARPRSPLPLLSSKVLIHCALRNLPLSPSLLFSSALLLPLL